MLPHIIAIVIVLWVILSYARWATSSYRAWRDDGIGRDNWLRKQVATYRDQAEWDRRQKAAQNYFVFIGILCGFYPLALLLIAYYLWNS